MYIFFICSKVSASLCLVSPIAKVIYPSNWQDPAEGFHEFTLTPDSSEYKEVEENFQKTIGATPRKVLEVCTHWKLCFY